MGAHEKYIRRALELAVRGEGNVEPNPMVGAVVARNGAIVGEGFHRRFGGPHAEVYALGQAGPKARGSTLYVNVEPCCPHRKKTPPCTDLVIRSGIREVVVAMRDPNPEVDGRGLALLRKAGIRVRTGILEGTARRLNAGFIKWRTRGLPYVIAKWAMSMDGKIATRTGDSKWITSPSVRRRARLLRNRVQAVLVGSRTALLDDPSLEAPKKRILRVVMDTLAQLPVDSCLVRSAKRSPVYVAIGTSAPPGRARALLARGCRVRRSESLNLRTVLQSLATEGISKVLIEGGGEILASAFEEQLVDEVVAYIAPKIVGGRDAKTPCEGEGVARMSQALGLEDVTVNVFGGEIEVRGRIFS